MDKIAVINIIDRFQKSLENQGIKVNKLILYGSYAHGDYRDSSDIDIVVISEDFADMDYWKRIDILVDAIYDVFAPIEAVAMTPEEWEKGDSFICDYAQDGELLYSAPLLSPVEQRN